MVRAGAQASATITVRVNRRWTSRELRSRPFFQIAEDVAWQAEFANSLGSRPHRSGPRPFFAVLNIELYAFAFF